MYCALNEKKIMDHINLIQLYISELYYGIINKGIF